MVNQARQLGQQLQVPQEEEYSLLQLALQLHTRRIQPLVDLVEAITRTGPVLLAGRTRPLIV